MKNLELTPPVSGEPAAKPAAFVSTRDALLAKALAQMADALKVISEAIAGEPKEKPATLAASGSIPKAVADESLTLGESIKAFLIHKARMNKSEGTIRYHRECLSKFARGKYDRALQSISVEEVQAWVDGYTRSKTRKTYLGSLRTFFRWAVRKGWMAEDLTARVDIPTVDDEAEPNPYTPEEARKILRHCAERNLDLCRHLAIRFFGGLRTSEAMRATEANILPSGYIEVSRAMSKTRRRRLVTILPNLRAWLALGGELRPFAQDTIREAIQEALRANGEPGKTRDNGTRSAFITYHLALHEDIAKTANQAGNSREVIETNYKGLGTKEQAEEYWNILPAEAQKSLSAQEERL